jgi:outer membrane protein
MTMKQRIIGCVVAGLLVSAPVLAADSVKIGYVDVRTVVLETLQQTLEKEMLTLTEAQKQDKQRGFQEKVQVFQKSAQDAEREVRQKDTEYTNKALEEVRKIITDVAKEEKVSLVLGKTEMSVLYAEDGMDLTAKVIKKYDSRPAPKK